MEICIIDLRNVSLTSGVVEEATLHASESQTKVVILQDSIVDEFCMHFPIGFEVSYLLNKTLSLKTLSFFISLTYKATNIKIFKYISGIFKESEENYTYLQVIRQDTITDVIENTENNKSLFLPYLDNENIKNEFELFLNIIMSVKCTERNLVIGSSLLDSSELNLRVDDNVENVLKMQEISRLRLYYQRTKEENLDFIDSYVNGKEFLLANYQDDSFDNLGELTLMDSYPRAYKYLSAYIYICAEENKRINNISVAYLLLFRVFETYCEGALISKELAKIDDHPTKGPSFYLKKVNEGYFCPNGFGKKWEVITDRSDLLSLCDEENLSLLQKHKKMRNIMIYTHGDLIVNHELLLELQCTVIEVINNMDTILQQESFMWNLVVEEMKGAFLYNPLYDVVKIMMNKHNLTITNLNRIN
ncbi:MAG: hypothetical protein JKY88_09210 [Pseudomonadales bacterium]|nr:hypothetical protein [Pseudomonadales bacterium]